MAPLILNLDTRCSWEVSFTYRPLCHREDSLPYSLTRMMDVPKKRSGPPTGE